MLERISENLSEAMQNKVAFRIPIFGGIPVPVSCVVTWIIMAILVIASILLTRNLKLIPDRKQMMLESFVGFLRDFFREQLGEKGMAYFQPALCSFCSYSCNLHKHNAHDRKSCGNIQVFCRRCKAQQTDDVRKAYVDNDSCKE